MRTHYFIALVLAFSCGCTQSTPDTKPPLDLKALSYETETVTFNETGRHVEFVKRAPVHAIRFGNGFLLGGNRGEWGGELVFRDEHGTDHLLLHENIQGIFATPTGAFVFTGIAHLGMNYGAIYDIPATGPRQTPKPKLVHKLIGVSHEITQTSEYTFQMRTRTYESGIAHDTPQLVSRCFVLNPDRSLIEKSCSEGAL